MQGIDPDKWEKDITPVSFFNPSNKPVEIYYLDDKNNASTVIIPPLQLVTYPKYQADIFIKRIFNQLVNERNLGFMNDTTKADLMKEILI